MRPRNETPHVTSQPRYLRRRLIPLTELVLQVEDYASRILPDIVIGQEESENARFNTCDGAHPVVLSFDLPDLPGRNSFLSDWARTQLLDHLGVKERWFAGVSAGVESEEMNLRLRRLGGFRFRRLGDGTPDGDEIVRGIVSPHYVELKDLDVVRAIHEIMPDTLCVPSLSLISMRAFYASLLLSEEITIPGTSLRGYPGLVIRNSEVGYTSLWAVPMLWIKGSHLPIVMKLPLVRKAHRGTIDLQAVLEEALREAQLWAAPLADKLSGLQRIHFPDMDTAVVAMRNMIATHKGPLRMAQRAETALRNTPVTSPTGEHVLLAVMTAVESEPDVDASYDHAQVAGGVLMALIA
jgi:hypothetical protein